MIVIINYVSCIFAIIQNGQNKNSVTMSHQLKLNCPICNYPKLTNLSHHLTTVHGISGKERKALLLRAHFSVSSTQSDQPQPSIPEADSTPTQFGNSLPKTSPLPEQNKLPNPTSDQTEDNLISCPYHSHISYERIWGTNVPVMSSFYTGKFVRQSE